MSQEVDLIKERLSIAEIVGEYAQLKNAGQNLKALCPFHGEKTPSFYVSPKRGTWHCFGACGEGGDIFSFIQKAEGIDFPAALKILAEKAGVELPRGGQMGVSTSRRQRLFDALSATASFYQAILGHEKMGAEARKYLHDRGLTDETIQAFQIGYAPNTWDSLQKALLHKGFTEHEMIEVGVIGRSERGKLFDRFRGRIIFPVHDSRGRVIAFGGRIVPWHETGNEGKYINSPETALYEKRFTVFNLHRAKKVLRQGAPCLVVEGYMDVAMLSQIGIENVVATSGTAFTDGHVQQLKRYTDVLHFAFDADAAGFKATIGATQAAVLAGIKVATIVMAAGTDPADLAKADPVQAKEALTKAEPLSRVLLHQLQNDSANKEQQLDALLPFVRLVKNPIQQGDMIESIAESLHIPSERVIELIEQAPAPQSFVDTTMPMRPEENAKVPVISAEKTLLGVILDTAEARQALFSYLEPELFLDHESLTLYKSLQQLEKANSSFLTMQPDAIIDALPERQRSFAEGVRSLAQDQLATSSQTSLQEGRSLVRSLRRRSLQQSLSKLQDQVAASADKERIAALEKFRALSHELANIDTF